ncbi:hypothetical protein [Roseospira goensis]|uniref:Uncharacterized protein n=1 Tax=Roseospira goensis TaxID=391922 RepID=A0A7W6S055_9PROT|nr:hypothetical protein [Roseospira goensis]MBB4285955.1 hypothetical protein [Roseospira goensis]
MVPIAGPDDLLAAALAAPAGAPLVVAGPPGAGESLGPGWPRALADALAGAWPRAAPERSPPPVVLVLDCGPAVGLALAVLEDWTAPPGWRLVLTLDPDTHPAARAALTARAERVGVMVLASCAILS